jgi:acetoin:2,6-dichlorophenolindophenol oxidoreductase subunit alpha
VIEPVPEAQLQTALRLHETMVRIRRFEERVGVLFKDGEMPGFVHLSIGQESVPAGVVDCLRRDDYITATHRGHGQIIAKGGRFEPMMAELFARRTGYCKGKGGSMHIFDVSLGVLGANGILGAGQPIAVGAAYSAQLRGTDQVAVTFFGEGASAQGAVHEAMNLAATWRAPVVFAAEINGFAELTAYDVHVSVPSIAARGAAYGIPSAVVDAVDVLDVRAASAEAVDRARHGEGPTLLELRTLRFEGHFAGDPQRYRDPADLERRASVDPLTRLEARLAATDVAREHLDEVERHVAAELDEAVAFARESPFPDPGELFDDVYATPVPVPGME